MVLRGRCVVQVTGGRGKKCSTMCLKSHGSVQMEQVYSPKAAATAVMVCLEGGRSCQRIRAGCLPDKRKFRRVIAARYVFDGANLDVFGRLLRSLF